MVKGSAWPSDKAEAAQLLEALWNKKWRLPARARWADRPTPSEVIEAVDSGWLPANGRVIDLGCGTADISAWFAGRGYEVTAVDIAQAALDRAAARHGALSASIELVAADLCGQSLPGRTFDILVDRGCLHQIPLNLTADYVRNISSIAAPGAKLLLFMKAYRDGRKFGGAQETELAANWTRRTFAGEFELERVHPTYLNPDNPTDPLPGIAFWLSRTPPMDG